MDFDHEVYSLPLWAGNKLTLSFRRLPLTVEDWKAVRDFLKIIEKNTKLLQPSTPNTEIPEPMGVAARVLHGHVPNEAEMARAAERIALRDNIRNARDSFEQHRQQVLREKKLGE